MRVSPTHARSHAPRRTATVPESAGAGTSEAPTAGAVTAADAEMTGPAVAGVAGVQASVGSTPTADPAV